MEEMVALVFGFIFGVYVGMASMVSPDKPPAARVCSCDNYP